ncbi:uncharacterized protein LY89DRAFT_660408 [Mollisia scopiformis]|uniref:Uncharacterized protein n=1 Tax=Mollisia scopiformis TaxID=149040 RepID=A0A132B5U4_MOLSC|nr:uncharacterized protein LY89DRAFT_660408 [Mollisia scopiformis]KUJ07623.1 hypothetical protein LY89DRAFT_660408 [Mollisia scopiformis]
MSSSTALLPKDRKKDDHPIFLRVCHSPWSGIGQKALVGLRGLAAAYMLASFALIINYELQHLKHDWLTIFEFSNVQYLLQVMYHVIAFTWTFMHLHYPHHGSQEQTFATQVQKFLSPPRQHATTKNRTWFSIFYSAANAFPFTSTLIHWAVMIPSKKTSIPADQIFNHGWHTTFFVLNKWGVSSLLSFIEVLFFSSIRCPEPVGAHVAGLGALSFIYVGWQYVGYIVSDKFAYFFFDHKQVGWEYVIASWFFFAIVNNISYFFVYGVTAVRQQLTKKGDGKKSGYQQLPQ